MSRAYATHLARRGGLSALGLATLLFAAPPRADAAEADATPPRVLGGHAFIPLLTVDWAFVDTAVVLAVGAGSADFVRSRDRAIAVTVLGEGRLETLFLTQNLRLRVAPLAWLAFGGELQTFGVVGTDPESAISFGGHAGVRGALRAIGQLLRSERAAVALRLGGQIGLGQGVVPQRLLDSVRAEDGTVTFDRPQISADVTLWGVQAGLAAAYAVNAHLGLQASATYGFRRLDFSLLDERAHDLDLGVGATLDGRDKVLPVAGVVGYRANLPLDGGAVVHQTEAGIYYSGRRNLSLGLAFNWWFRPDELGLGNTFLGFVQVGYFW